MEFISIFALMTCIVVAVVLYLGFGYVVHERLLDENHDVWAILFIVLWMAFGLTCIIYAVGGA